MITFEDVKVEDHETYTVLPADIAGDMSWFLTRNGIEYSRLSVRDIENKKRPNVSKLFNKEKMYQLIQPFVEKGADDMNPYIIVSHLNSDDLIKKAFWMLEQSRDKDLVAYEENATEKAMRRLNENKELNGIPMRKQAPSVH